MTMLRLDYQREMKPFPWAGVALLVLAFALSALAGIYYRNLSGKVAYWEARGGQASSAQNHMSVSLDEANNMATEIRYANKVLNKIDLPWDRLFQAVESASGKDVALLAMEPNPDKHEVKISGEARNIDAVLDYIARLSTQEIFASVYLHSHQVQLRDPEKPVRFSLIASWKEAP